MFHPKTAHEILACDFHVCCLLIFLVSHWLIFGEILGTAIVEIPLAPGIEEMLTTGSSLECPVRRDGTMALWDGGGWI